MSGLTEAYYRKLPILAVTSTKKFRKSAITLHSYNRSSMPNDIVKYSVQLPLVKDNMDWWNCEVKANEAILELSRHGGGPVHINLATGYSRLFDTKELPKVRVIKRITTQASEYPSIPKGKVAVFIGSHKK